MKYHYCRKPKNIVFSIAVVCVFGAFMSLKAKPTSFELAKALYEKGEFGQSEKTLEAMEADEIEKNPESSRLLGVLYAKDGRFGEAINQFEISWKNGSSKALRNLASAKLETEDLEWFKKNKKILLSFLQNDPQYYDVFLVYVVKSNDFQVLHEAIECVKDDDIVNNQFHLENTLNVFRWLINNTHFEED